MLLMLVYLIVSGKEVHSKKLQIPSYVMSDIILLELRSYVWICFFP